MHFFGIGSKLHKVTKLHEDNFATRVKFERRIIFAQEKKTEKKDMHINKRKLKKKAKTSLTKGRC